MSDYHEQIDFEFTGAVWAIESKTTRNDKKFTALVLERERGKYKDYCCVTFWQSLPDGCAVGAVVTASGRIGGREYNGKYYSDLTAAHLSVKAAPKQEPARDEADGQGDGEIPF